MQCSPHDIKEQLVRALDHDHNVVDMVAVLNCIRLLETLPIRREDLERTRLGRVINELRKKTPDVALQRRAKDLVRSWRRLLEENPPAVGQGPIPNGIAHHHPHGPHAPHAPHTPHTPHVPHAAQEVSSPALSGGAPATPATPLGASHGGGGHGGHTRVAQLQMQSGVVIGAGGHAGRTTSPALSSSVSNSPVLRTRNGSGFKPVSPAVPTGSPSPNAVAPLASHAGGAGAGQPSTPPAASNANKAPNRNSVANKRLRKGDRNGPPETGSTGTTTTTSSAAKRLRQTNGFDSLLPGSAGGAGDTGSGNGTSGSAGARAASATGSSIPSGNSAFESLVRPDSRTGSVHSDDASSNGASGVGGNGGGAGTGGGGAGGGGGGSSGTPSARIVPKVKTTQQLIDELKAKSGVNVSIDDVVREPAPPDRGISPAVAAAKGRRGRPPMHARDSPPVTPSLPLARQAAVNNAAFNRLLNGGTSDRELTQNKTELMDRFLLSSPQSQSDDSNHLPAAPTATTGTAAATPAALTNGHHSGQHLPSSLSRLANGVAPTSGTLMSQMSPKMAGPSGAPLVSYDDVDADIDRILSKLPPLPPDVYDWRSNGPKEPDSADGEADQEMSPAPSAFPARISAAPTEEELERISNGRWPCVNGNYDMHGEWRPWNELMMARSAGEEPLPVLPYVDIEW